ncbi:DinB family protein [Paenibacillus sp. LHD-117]|uniref:DinB family protein n=1 Tax=Paenibacillus sp. LHD-117 TaxID=3071412 RepID=UPI0027E00AAE|nr:DinB family protein [Paenibacillus sp. LHD-117]MDQ6423100.1 DinB family protein [Paenibacillus sp. LHD-117]
MVLPKPLDGLYPPPFNNYIVLVPESDPVQLLKEQGEAIDALYESIGEERSFFRYEEGKWSLKEVLGHIMDTERITSYRLMCAARGDQTPLPRHPDQFVNFTKFDRRPLAELVAEYRAVRAATLALVQGLEAEELGRTGVVNDTKTIASALVYFIAGHAEHHLRIVRERYLPKLGQ